MGLPIFFEKTREIHDNRRDRSKRICSCHTCNQHNHNSTSTSNLRPGGNAGSSARRRLMNLRAAQRRNDIDERNVRPRLEDDAGINPRDPSQATLTELWSQPRSSDNIELLRQRILADLGSEASEYINIRPDETNEELVHIEMDLPNDRREPSDNVVREAWRLLGGINTAMNSTATSTADPGQDSRYITPPSNTLTPFTAIQHRDPPRQIAPRRSVSSSSTASTRTVGR